jgi:hypothetical protein
MKFSRYAFELLFGIGFKVGFLIAIVSMMVMYMPIMVRAVNPLLKIVGFWDAFYSNPLWAQALITGVILMVVALLVNLVKGWFEPLIDTLFFEDKVLQFK